MFWVRPLPDTIPVILGPHSYPTVSTLIVSFPGGGEYRGKEDSKEQEDIHYSSNPEPGIFLDRRAPEQHIKVSLKVRWGMIDGGGQMN